MSLLCEFVPSKPGLLLCKVCKETLASEHPPEQTRRACRAKKPKPCGDCDPPAAAVTPPAMPSLGRTLWNATAALARVAEAKLKGEQVTLPIEKVKDRLDICQTCEWMRHDLGRCSHIACGCFVEVKARLSTEHCPLEKWPGD